MYVFDYEFEGIDGPQLIALAERHGWTSRRLSHSAGTVVLDCPARETMIVVPMDGRYADGNRVLRMAAEFFAVWLLRRVIQTGVTV